MDTEIVHTTKSSKLPGQDRTTFDTEKAERQEKIIVIGFSKYLDFGVAFPTKMFEATLHRYLTKNGFFNEKNFKGKRAKGGTHLTPTHTHKAFYEFGARTTSIIRPKCHPDVNWHKITRDFNFSLNKSDKIVSLWLSQDYFDKCLRSKETLELTLKVVHYEIESKWNWRLDTKLRLRERVSDYTRVIL